MNGAQLLTDAFGRVREAVHAAVADLDDDDLVHRVDAGANTIAWLLWHLARVQDMHVTEIVGGKQVWLEHGWYDRFGLSIGRHATGYGDTAADVAAVRASAALLTGYYDAVHERTEDFVAGLHDSDFDRVVDAAWDPPVTLGVRLVSVIEDDLQHAGQASYLRGMMLRARKQ